VGLSSAYHIKRLSPGLTVSLVERNARLCSGNSGRSAALYRNLFLSKTSRDLAESSIIHYRSIAGAIALKSLGYLWTFGLDEWERLRSQALELTGLALDAELLEGDALAAATAMAPEPAGPYPEAGGAVLGRLCGALSAHALAAWYAERFTELGGHIVTGADIAGFDLANGGHELPSRVSRAMDARGERYEAERFLVAGGCWSQDILGPLGVASAVYPKKRQLFGFSAARPELLYGQAAYGSPALILPYGGIYLKPVPERGIAVAGRADDLGRSIELPYGPAAALPRAEEDYFRAYIEPALAAYFPALAAAYPRGLELKQAWAGHYDYHWPDKNPVLERSGNVFWTGGSSGSGIMKGDGLGRAAAAALLDMDEVALADGRPFRPADLSLRARSVAAEGLVI
jgi:FAD-dependent oxidoreductase domain-containing protein 1